jgi:alkylation response protein AidB-like acyl-CoA dehydrogenase
MDFAFSEEQDEFREVLRRFFEEHSGLGDVRMAFDSADGFDRGLWKKMGEELGLQGVHLPEKFGGQGFGFLELGLVLEEMGRALVPSPFLASSVLAAGAIRAAGTDEEQAEWLPGIASGERIGGLAWVEAGGSWEPAAVATEAKPDGDSLVLTGTKEAVLSGDLADFVVVAARLPGTSGEDGVTLAVVEAVAPGVTVTALEAVDLTRRQARIVLEGARAKPLGTPGQAANALRTCLLQAAVALGAEALGGADRALEMAVEYAKVRVQFARPIGSFQGIKHMAAEVLRDLELARAAAYWSWWVADESPAELAQAAPLAKAACADAFLAAAAANIQIHGGIGFTWEHDAHLFYRRAKSLEFLLGDSSTQRSALATALGI